MPISGKYISSLTQSKVIGWTDQGAEGKQNIASGIMVEDLDFEICTTLFKDEYINNHTHMCGHAVNNTQNIELVII